ncbi:pilus assembly protein TadG-related protein [Bradyrhizobium sp. Arg314]
MIRDFFHDRRGNYALMTVITMIPLMGAVALAVDYTELVRERQQTLNALDAAGIATAQQIVAGASDADAKAYAKTFFEANLRHVLPANTTLTVTLPSNNAGGGALVLEAAVTYRPYFLPAAVALLGGTPGQTNISFSARSEIRLKNTLEVALVLDNSGSMTDISVSNQVRFDLLKGAAKQLVDQLAGQAQLMKQVSKPVQFSLVPFAASVNVGASNEAASWMDTKGISPIHHENFDWTTMSQMGSPWGSTKYAEKVGDAWYARGTGWDASQKDRELTRTSLYKQMQRVATTTSTTSCTGTGRNKVCTTTTTPASYASVAGWGGCVESRPYPYNIQDTPASTSNPATLFVPMFAPDETDNNDRSSRPAYSNWHADVSPGTDAERQRYMPKYFITGTAVTPAYGMNEGPNTSCSTTAIMPLTDVSTTAGATSVKTAINAMAASGATNVPEGMAWGWRTLSSASPFTEGRPETEKGNDKVLIVLTDGANTYYTPNSLRYNDLAGAKSTYSALGYLKPYNTTYSYGRPFLGTSSNVSKTDYSNANYTKAMNEHFATLCNNAKAANIIVMTIALDLDSRNTAEAAQMAALKTCSSDSRFRKDATDPSKPKKLFWNSTGATLSDDFREIGNELSNLRIVS